MIVLSRLGTGCSRGRSEGPTFATSATLTGTNRIRPERRKINHIHQLEALGQPAGQPRRQFVVPIRQQGPVSSGRTPVPRQSRGYEQRRGPRSRSGRNNHRKGHT